MYQYQTNRPIAAFSMADYESLTGVAEFKRGKDKKKRKRRGMGIAAGIGAGVAGAGALAGGIRYGGAELARRNARGRSTKLGEAVGSSQSELLKARNKYDAGRKLGGTAYADKTYGGLVSDAQDSYERAYGAGKRNAAVMTAGGAKGQLSRDYNRLRNVGGGRVGNTLDGIKAAAKNTGRAIQGGYRKGFGANGLGSYSGLGSGKRVASGAMGAVRAGLGTTGGKIGAGALGAAALAGGGYAAYKAMQKRKKNK